MPQNNESPHIGLNTRNWKEGFGGPITREKITEQSIYFSREARQSPTKERTNPVVVSFSDFTKLVKTESILSTDIATTKIYDWAREQVPAIQIWTSSPTPTTEEVLKELVSLSDFNTGSSMVWISPKGEVYAEARINIYQTIEVNGKKYLFFWGIPTQHTDQQCFGFYRKLTALASEIPEVQITNDAEDLRINPIPLQIPPDESFTSFFAKQIPLFDVWGSVANGQIIQKTIEEFAVGRPIIWAEYEAIMEAKTEYERRLVGARIENALQRQLAITLCPYAHGDLNSNFLANPSGINSLFTTGRLLSPLSNETSKERVHCGKCGQYQKGEKMETGFVCNQKSQN